MKNIFSILAVLFITNIGQAQIIDRQVVASGGSYTANGNAQVSFTIGETAIQYLAASGASLSQGFQQGNSTSSSIHSITQIDAKIMIYPNPFINFIEVKSDNFLSKPTFKLVDIAGKTIPIASTELLNGKHWRLQLNNRNEGNYALIITSGNLQSSFPLTKLTY